MGVERWYVAVVDGPGLLGRARVDPEFGEFLAGPAFFGRDRRAYEQGGLDADILAEVDAMNRAHPGIERRVCTVDKDFDALHYLLSPARRRGDFDPTDLGTIAILGAQGLPGHLRGGQGHSVRYSPPEAVSKVAAWLGGLTAGDLRPAFNPPAMEAECVYKFWADRADTAWEQVARHFEGLRSFYVEVAAHGEGVLAMAT